MVLDDRLDGPDVAQAGDGLVAGRRIRVVSAARRRSPRSAGWVSRPGRSRCRCGRPAVIRKSRPVTRSTWKAIAFSPGSSCGSRPSVPLHQAGLLLGDLLAGRDRAPARACRVSSDGSRNARLLDGVRRAPRVSRPYQASPDRRWRCPAVATRHLDGRWFVGSTLTGLVQQDDDSNEGQDGEQHPNQDDQTIGSLHGDFLLTNENECPDESRRHAGVVTAVNSLRAWNEHPVRDLWASPIDAGPVASGVCYRAGRAPGERPGTTREPPPIWRGLR